MKECSKIVVEHPHTDYRIAIIFRHKKWLESRELSVATFCVQGPRNKQRSRTKLETTISSDIDSFSRHFIYRFTE